jgi:hypothetical protein
MSSIPTRQARGSSTGNCRGNQWRGLNRNHATTVGSAGDQRSPGHVKFEHIPSISRSSGVDPDGDTYVYIGRSLEILFLLQIRID